MKTRKRARHIASFAASAICLSPALSWAAAPEPCKFISIMGFGGGTSTMTAPNLDTVKFDMVFKLPADVMRLTNLSIPASVPAAERGYTLRLSGTYYRTADWEYERIWLEFPPLVGPDGTTPATFSAGGMSTPRGRLNFIMTPPVAGKPMIFEIRDPAPATGKSGRPHHPVAGGGLSGARALSGSLGGPGGMVLAFFAPSTAMPNDFERVFNRSRDLLADAAARNCTPVP